MILRLGGIEIEKTAALAPMAGFADRAFREICRSMGAAYSVGEMASAKGICYGSQKSAELLSVSEAERPVAVQLFGDEPETMAKAALRAIESRPAAIDINMGCPAPKISGGAAKSGAALMKDPKLAESIIKAVVEATAPSGIPVTVKIRKGWDESSVNAVDIAVMAERAGAVAITVHGRTKAQMYAPPVDFDIIKAVKNAVSIPVIGNGDIDSVDAAVKMYEYTGCDLVMIGRGALGKPWLFTLIKAFFVDGIRLPEPSQEEKYDIMLRHIRLACEYKGEYTAMREARSHCAHYFKGMRGAAELRRMTGKLTHLSDLRLEAGDNPWQQLIDLQR